MQNRHADEDEEDDEEEEDDGAEDEEEEDDHDEDYYTQQEEEYRRRMLETHARNCKQSRCPVPRCIEFRHNLNLAHQATRAYSTPPIFPELDERHTTNDYGLVHLAMTVAKRPIFHAIIHLLPPSEAALVLQCRKVFVTQVGQAAEAEIHRHLQALQYYRHALPWDLPAPKLRSLHYLQQIKAVLMCKAPRGYRFPVTKSADVQPPPHLAYDMRTKVEEGDLASLLQMCLEWSSHPVMNKDMYWSALMEAKKRGFATAVAMLEAAGAVLRPELAAAYAFVDEHIATTRGFRLPKLKPAGAQPPTSYVDGKYFHNLASNGDLDTLLKLCQEWSGHSVIFSYKDSVSHAMQNIHLPYSLSALTHRAKNPRVCVLIFTLLE